MSGEIAYGLRILREDADYFDKLGLPDSAARARAAADKIEALAKKADAKAQGEQS